MYNYDFKDKWHASQLNTADKWDVERYRKDNVDADGRNTNQKQQKENVKLNNYFSYGDGNSPVDIRYKNSNSKVN